MSSNLTFILLIFLPLMAVMAASDLFVAEQADHTIRFPSCARWEREALLLQGPGGVCAVRL